MGNNACISSLIMYIEINAGRIYMYRFRYINYRNIYKAGSYLYISYAYRYSREYHCSSVVVYRIIHKFTDYKSDKQNLSDTSKVPRQFKRENDFFMDVILE